MQFCAAKDNEGFTTQGDVKTAGHKLAVMTSQKSVDIHYDFFSFDGWFSQTVSKGHEVNTVKREPGIAYP